METETTTRLHTLFITVVLYHLGQTEVANIQSQDSISFNVSRLLVTSNLTFPYTIIDNEVSTLNFSYQFLQEAEAASGGWVIIFSVDNDKIVGITSDKEVHIEPSRQTGTLSVSLKGKLPGRALLYIRAIDQRNASATLNSGQASEKYGQTSWQLYVERKDRPIDVAFNVIVILLVVMANVGMGAKVDLAVVKTQLKRPIAPLIGLFSQFVFMPLIAFTVAYTIELDPGIALGFLALGCSPGGSASNAYTYLLDGNVSLSVTMTLVSTLASLGLLPMWLFTLGRVIYSKAKFKIPFENIFFSLLGIILPVLFGLLLQRKCPKAANFCIRAVKYIMFIFILFILTVGVYANLFIFSLLSGEVLLAAALLPYLGFILGGLAAFIGRQDVSNILTIAVETGIQNTGIPIVLLRLSLQGPDKDTSIVAPVASAIFTPIPLIFGILFVQIKKRMTARRATRDYPVGESALDGSQSAKQNNLKEIGAGDYIPLNKNEDYKT